MREQFKRLLSVLLVVVMVFSVLAGCEKNSPAEKEEKSGKIVFSYPMGAVSSVFKEVAKQYMVLNPKVEVEIMDKPIDGYQDWIINAWASGGEAPADIVTVHYFPQYIKENKFVFLDSYLQKANPYMDGKVWKDGLEPNAYSSAGDNKFLDDRSVCISIDTVMTAWFYNKTIFQKVGVQPPKTWDEFIIVCDKIKKAGYIPIAMGGNPVSLSYGWLLYTYTDQYFRDMEPQIASKPNDFNYDAEKDGAWEFNASDKSNDSPLKVTFNMLRAASMIKDQKYGPMTEKYKSFLENFKKIIPTYCPDDFFGVDTGMADFYFYNGKAAMQFNGSEFTTQFPIMMNRSVQKEKFDYGYFYSPPMTGDKVGADYTRSVGGATGYLGVIDKSNNQNDLSVDFLMYYASIQGQNVRLNAMKENKQSPYGKILVKGVELPGEWEKQVNQIEYIGECYNNPSSSFALGWLGDNRSTRDARSVLSNYFIDKINVDQATTQLQQALSEGIDRWIETSGFRSDCLLDPSKDPVK